MAISNTKTKKNIVIAGAGIVGASIGFNLSQRSNINLTLIDIDIPGQGASKHSFAWLNSYYKMPEHYWHLNKMSMDMWHRFASELGNEVGLVVGGDIRWVKTKKDADDLIAKVNKMQSLGYKCNLIDRDELQDLEPNLHIDEFEVGYYGANDAHVEPLKVIDACLGKIRDNGGTFLPNTSIDQLILENGIVTGVNTSKGIIECDTFVIAAGTGTPSLASLAGINIPLVESPGSGAKTLKIPPLLNTAALIHLPAIDKNNGQLHVRQFSDGSLMIGEGSQESVSNDESNEHALNLLERARHYLPIPNVDVAPMGIGYRPMPADGLPIVGFSDQVPNMYIAVTHSGVTLSPVLGTYASMEILDEQKVDYLENYRLERFLDGEGEIIFHGKDQRLDVWSRKLGYNKDS